VAQAQDDLIGQPIDVRGETNMITWGILISGHRLDTESKCWRCLQETVPEEDELGLCDWCIASLQDH
jgi:hypothetical protein